MHLPPLTPRLPMLPTLYRPARPRNREGLGSCGLHSLRPRWALPCSLCCGMLLDIQLNIQLKQLQTQRTHLLINNPASLRLEPAGYTHVNAADANCTACGAGSFAASQGMSGACAAW